MKKSKLIPSILLLVLCLAVMGVGIYAAIPTSTSIEGTLTIIAPARELDISGVVTGAKESRTLSTDSVHDVTSWNLSTLSFDLSNRESLDEVEDIEIKVHIKNKSIFEYGAYFYKKNATLDAKGNATINSFENLNSSIVNSDNVKLADVTLSDYTHIMPNDDNKTNTTLDEINMTIKISLAEFFINAPASQGFEYILKIENYQSNYDADEYNSGPLATSDEFIKVSSHVNASNTSDVRGLSATALASKTPRTEITTGAFSRNNNLKKIIIPGTVQKIGSNAFGECSNLESIILSKNLTEFDSDVYDGCNKLKRIYMPGEYILYDGALKIDSSVTNLTNKWFSLADKITSVEIPNTADVSDGAFSSCREITSVKYTKNVEGYYSFVNGVLSFPNNISSLNVGSFDSCINNLITELQISKNITSIASAEYEDMGGYTEIDYSSAPFGNSYNIQTLTFERGGANNLTINPGTFRDLECTKVYIPSRVILKDKSYAEVNMTFCDPAISGEIIFYIESLDLSNFGTYWNIKNTLIIDEGVSEEDCNIYFSGATYRDYLNNKALGTGYAYDFNTNTLTITSSTVARGAHDWDKLKNMAEILFISKGVTSIQSATYQKTYNVGENGLEPYINNDGPFYDIPNLTHLIIEPGANTTIGAGAFRGCRNLQYVYLPTGVTMEQFFLTDSQGREMACGPFIEAGFITEYGMTKTYVYFEDDRDPKWLWRDHSLQIYHHEYQSVIYEGGGEYAAGTLQYPAVVELNMESAFYRELFDLSQSWFSYYENAAYEDFLQHTGLIEGEDYTFKDGTLTIGASPYTLGVEKYFIEDCLSDAGVDASEVTRIEIPGLFYIAEGALEDLINIQSAKYAYNGLGFKYKDGVLTILDADEVWINDGQVLEFPSIDISYADKGFVEIRDMSNIIFSVNFDESVTEITPSIANNGSAVQLSAITLNKVKVLEIPSTITRIIGPAFEFGQERVYIYVHGETTFGGLETDFNPEYTYTYGPFYNYSGRVDVYYENYEYNGISPSLFVFEKSSGAEWYRGHVEEHPNTSYSDFEFILNEEMY